MILGALDLADKCQQIENLVETKETKNLLELFHQLEKTYSLTCNELEKLKYLLEGNCSSYIDKL